MDIRAIANNWAAAERNEANRGKRVNQKGWRTKEQMRKDASEKALAIALLIAVISVVIALIKGLFSKNKTVRAFSAICLVAIGIGLAAFMMHESPRGSAVVSKRQDGMYARMTDQQFTEECATILGQQEIADETEGSKEFRTKIILFRDLMRKTGVPDEALRDSYASGGFEALHNVSTTELKAKLNDGYTLENLINSLNKGLLEIDMPEWERHELKIRRCLDSLLPQSERWRSRFGDVMTWGDNEEILMLEAIEIIRALQSMKTIDGFLVSSSMDAPTTSKECAEMIVREQNCPAIVEKWIGRMGTWTIAWGTPANAPGSTPILLSPSFPIQEFLNGGKRFDEVFTLKNPALLVLKNGKMHILHSNHKYSRFELANEAQGIGESRGIAYLTPTGMIQPLTR